jgi:hypothetical protein
MELLVVVRLVECRFGLFGDSVSVDARYVHGLCKTYHKLNRFGHTRWYSYVTRLKWKLVLACLEIMLMLTQDRCTICTKRTIRSKIILEAPDGTRR